MTQDIKNDITYFFKLENDIKLINDKLSIIDKLEEIIIITYNTNIYWDKNYEFYRKNKIIPNIKINKLLFNEIKNINLLCKQKSDLEFIFRKKKIKINKIKNNIINNIINNNIQLPTKSNNVDIFTFDKYKSIMNFPKPKNSLNIPELRIRNILFNIQKNNKEIILIYPQYRLPVKFKSYLFADFYLLFYINNTIFPLIIEFDGPKHTNKQFIYFSKNSIKCDIIKNNFAICNNISIIRIYKVDDITNEIDNCIQNLYKNTCYTCIPSYNSYMELL